MDVADSKFTSDGMFCKSVGHTFCLYNFLGMQETDGGGWLRKKRRTRDGRQWRKRCWRGGAEAERPGDYRDESWLLPVGFGSYLSELRKKVLQNERDVPIVKDELDILQKVKGSSDASSTTSTAAGSAGWGGGGAPLGIGYGSGANGNSGSGRREDFVTEKLEFNG